MSRAILSRSEYLECLGWDIAQAQPNDKVIQATQGKEVVIISGPTAVGKDLAIDRLMPLSGVAGMPILHQVRSRVTRDRRPNERRGQIIPYETYYDLGRLGVRGGLRRAIRGGEFVQALSHPTTREVYGTTPRSFSGDGLHIAQMTLRECQRIQAVGMFSEIISILIVAADPDELVRQWEIRDGKNPEGRLERLLEASDSLGMCEAREIDTTVVPQFYDNTSHLRLADVIRGNYDPELDRIGRESVVELKRRVDEQLGELSAVA